MEEGVSLCWWKSSAYWLQWSLQESVHVEKISHKYRHLKNNWMEKWQLSLFSGSWRSQVFLWIHCDFSFEFFILFFFCLILLYMFSLLNFSMCCFCNLKKWFNDYYVSGKKEPDSQTGVRFQLWEPHSQVLRGTPIHKIGSFSWNISFTWKCGVVDIFIFIIKNEHEYFVKLNVRFMYIFDA